MSKLKIDSQYIGVVIGGVDAFTGEPITRTKRSHPYSYQPFEVFGTGEDATGSMYSDRMYQWDHEKYNRCCEAVWGDQGQYFDRRSPGDIERFLRLYLENDSVKLTRVVEGCNVASGFPFWHFSYRSENETRSTGEGA